MSACVCVGGGQNLWPSDCGTFSLQWKWPCTIISSIYLLPGLVLTENGKLDIIKPELVSLLS